VRLLAALPQGISLLLHDRKSLHGEASVLTVLPLLLERINASGLTSVSLQMAMR
jgi:hypothetical protein